MPFFIAHSLRESLAERLIVIHSYTQNLSLCFLALISHIHLSMITTRYQSHLLSATKLCHQLCYLLCVSVMKLNMIAVYIFVINIFICNHNFPLERAMIFHIDLFYH